VAETNVELARRGFEAALRGDLDAIAELLDPDVQWHGGDPSARGACHSRGEAIAFMRQSDVIRGGRFELVDVVGAGDKVVVVIRPPSTADQPAAPVANVTTFREGKVVEMVHYANAADALAAVGA
jgi:ketosteroid isomerase-like protein